MLNITYLGVDDGKISNDNGLVQSSALGRVL